MATAKDIAVHGVSGINNVLNYVSNEEKTIMSNCGYDIDNLDPASFSELQVLAQENNKLFSYAENLEKTSFALDGDEEILVSGYRCSPETASIEFQLTRDKYMRYVGSNESRIHGTKTITIRHKDGSTTTKEVPKESIETHHIIQSFPEIPGLDPRLVHHLGLELAKRAFTEHKCVIATHMNTNHLHNHIIMCAYNEDSIGKYHSNKANRNRYRAINDEISLEYGLPILLDNELSHKSLSWLEWDARSKGESWKDTVRADIKLISSLSSSWEDYINRMKSAGYGIRETDKYVTYTMAGSDIKKVRDKNLGDEYMRSELNNLWQQDRLQSDLSPEHSIVKSKDENNYINTTNTPVAILLHIDRYTESGRRRTDLEMIFLKAIKLLKFFMDQFRDEDSAQSNLGNPIYFQADIKIQAMEQALYACQQLGISTKEDLKTAMNNVGAALSHQKKELSSLEESIEFYIQTSEKIKTLEALKKEINHFVNISTYHFDDLYLSSYTDEVILRNLAEAMPMTSKQRRDLFIKIQDSGWHLKYKFDCITYTEANNIIDFLNGKTKVKPTSLLTEEEYSIVRLENKYKVIKERYNNSLRSKYNDIPITNQLVNILTHLLADKCTCLNIDINTLSCYQALLLINQLSGNKFNEPLASSETQVKIKKLLAFHSLTINRPIEYILEREATELAEYITAGSGSKPDLLKSSSPASYSQRAQLKELITLKSEKCSIPLEYLSSLDADKLLAYLLNKSENPIDLIAIEDSKVKDEAFIKSLGSLDFKDRAVLMRYRNILNDLKSLGFDINDLAEISTQLDTFRETYTETQARVDELKTEYKNLSKLNYSLNLAQNSAFTHGPLYRQDSKEVFINPGNTQNHRDISYGSAHTDESTPKEKQHSRTKKELFKGIDEHFFDRM